MTNLAAADDDPPVTDEAGIDEDGIDGAGRAAPRSLIVTTYGLYAREDGGWLSVSGLIRLLDTLDVDAPAVRSSISRLKKRNLLVPERRDGAAGYALSAAGQLVLAEGDRRIFDHRRATLADGWLMIVFSIPEAQRRKRHQMRTRLSSLGFGTVSSGVWIAPAHLHTDAEDLLRAEGLDEYADLFHVDHLGFRDVREEAARWWDLTGLAELYEDFLQTYAPVLSAWQEPAPDTGPASGDPAAFADYVRALTTWRRLPFLDPGLPAEIVGAGWAGDRAGRLFVELRDRLAVPAARHARSVLHGEG